MSPLLTIFTDRVRANLLVAVTISYIIGGALARAVNLEEALLLPLMTTVIAACIALLPFHRRQFAALLVLPLFLLIGLLHTADALRPPDDPNHLYNLVRERAKVTLTGTILNMPEYDGQKTRFDLAADSILFHRDQPGNALEEPAWGKIRLSLEDTLPPSMTAGSRIMTRATVSRIHNYRTPGVFDYRLYLAERNIHVSGRIQSQLELMVFRDLNAPHHTAVRFIPERWRQQISTFLQNRFNPDIAGIYQALLIGSRAGISDTILEQFKATGCMHLLAISGIHMSLLGLMVTLALTWIMKRSSWLLLHTHVPTIATLLALLPLTVYAFIAGLNTPVLRSLLMSSLFLIGVVLQRQRSILFIVAAAALLLLIWKPLALFTVSFQLSFASILAIAFIYPRLLHKLESHQLAGSNRIRTYISSALLVSLAASLGSLPLMLFHFNRFSLIGPVMNLLVEPFLCLWALPLGLLAIPLIFIAPQAAGMLLEAGSMGILAADKITMAGSRIPFASFWTITPSITEIILFYILLFLWLVHAGTLRKKMLLGSGSIILILFFTGGLWFSFPSATAELAFLDVGQGSSSMIRLPGGRTMLIDGGSTASPSFHVGERVIAPFLHKKRTWRLDDVIITHPDSDHANGIDVILEHFKPERLWINGDGKTNHLYQKILGRASELGIRTIEPETGRVIEPEPGARITFVQGATPHQPGLSVNDRSLVIRLDHQQNSFLFPGDISKTMEKELVEKGANLKADLLLAPHHGSRSSSSAPFMAAVDPRVVVVSSGRSVRGHYFDGGHRLAWEEAGRTVLATAELGTVTITADGTRLFINEKP
ncbi:MAG: DNA internalization-related competence protein ComEC/Rec2 [Desulfobulbaceae bacterium]|nr:DNA internalization-related competence protein ComEC/Rec2 [Desulfobulbaceae bacterium]